MKIYKNIELINLTILSSRVQSTYSFLSEYFIFWKHKYI